jgi:hypothetical protein
VGIEQRLICVQNCLLLAQGHFAFGEGQSEARGEISPHFTIEIEPHCSFEGGEGEREWLSKPDLSFWGEFLCIATRSGLSLPVLEELMAWCLQIDFGDLQERAAFSTPLSCKFRHSQIAKGDRNLRSITHEIGPPMGKKPFLRLVGGNENSIGGHILYRMRFHLFS